MSDTHTKILSAFCDGEVVDPAALRDALGDVQAREALVDFARVRAAIASTGPLPASLRRLRPLPIAARLTRPAWAALAAAMALLGVLTGALLSRVWTMKRNDDVPPAPSRVVRYVPGVDWQAIPR